MFKVICFILFGTIAIQLGIGIADAPLPAIAIAGAIGALSCLGAFLAGRHEYKKSLVLAVIVPIALFAFGAATIAVIDHPVELKLWFSLGLIMFGMVLPAGTIGMMLFLNMSWISFGFDLLFKKVEESAHTRR